MRKSRSPQDWSRRSSSSGQPGRHHPVPFGGDIVHFQHQFHPGRRPPGGRFVRHHLADRADPHRAAPQRDVVVLVTAVVGELKAEHTLVEVNRGIEVRREDLKPQRHVHDGYGSPVVSYQWRGPFRNAELSALHAAAFSEPARPHDWQAQLTRHSLGWVCARYGAELAGGRADRGHRA